MWSFEREQGDRTFGARLVTVQNGVVRRQTAPAIVTIGLGQLVGDDALGASSSLHLCVGMGSQVKAPRGRRVQSAVRGGHQESGAVVETDDWHSPRSSAVTAGCG